MADKFKNKYRIQSTRLQNWDYRWSAAYFITICTQNRECYFGRIDDETMILSPIGTIADVLWHELKFHAKNIELDAFVVMPNHIHGIIVLNGDNNENGIAVDTGHALYLQHHNQLKNSIGQQRFQNIGKNSVSSIIGSYKSAVAKHANRLGFDFKWQSLFHDHIIRNEESFKRIQSYIIQNPANWTEDKFHSSM